MGMELCQSDKIGGLRNENRPSPKKYRFQQNGSRQIIDRQTIVLNWTAQFGLNCQCSYSIW